jgi:dihydroxyacetone kinase
MMPAKELVERMMAMLMDQNDTDRSFLKLSSGDFCVLLVNNLGGLSQLELNLVVKHAVEYILLKHNVVLQRVYVGSFVTSLNMPGFSLSLLLVDNQQGQLELLDQPVQIPGWPSCPAYSFSEQIIEEETIIEESMTDVVKEEEEGGGGGGNNSHIRDAICSAAKAVIKAEPLVTEYDTILGDGDCGQTLKTAALGK